MTQLAEQQVLRTKAEEAAGVQQEAGVRVQTLANASAALASRSPLRTRRSGGCARTRPSPRLARAAPPNAAASADATARHARARPRPSRARLAERQQRAAEERSNGKFDGEKDTIDRQLEAARKTIELKVAAEREQRVERQRAERERDASREKIAAMREAVAAAEGRTGRAEDEVQAQQTALALTVEQLQRRSAEVDELNEANRALASQIADLQLGALQLNAAISVTAKAAGHELRALELQAFSGRHSPPSRYGGPGYGRPLARRPSPTPVARRAASPGRRARALRARASTLDRRLRGRPRRRARRGGELQQRDGEGSSLSVGVEAQCGGLGRVSVVLTHRNRTLLRDVASVLSLALSKTTAGARQIDCIDCTSRRLPRYVGR